MENHSNRPKGMTTFIIIWVGQVVSLLGTGMTGFALTLWAYEITGKATPLALVGFFFVTPMTLLSPFVGTLVDRSNRKLMMMLSDLAAAFNTIVILVLFTTDNLQIWHLYVTATIAGIFNGFQWPAFSAAISIMIPKKHYVRANGMMEMAGPASQILAPLLAGALIVPIGMKGILIIDLISASAAIGTLLFVHIPQPPRTEEGRAGEGNFLQETAYGFRYIFARPSLLGLQIIFLIGNLFISLSFAVFAPLILARTNNNEIIFASVQTAGAIGGVLGGVVMSIWGGPKRRIHGVLLGWASSGLLVLPLLGIAQNQWLWMAGILISGIPFSVVNGSNQAIWQAKVAPDVQGRVFGVRRLIAWFVSPISRLIAGPLADNVMEPAMQVNGSLAPIFGDIVGTGPGAGIGLTFLITGLLAGIAAMSGYLFPIIRNVEDILPDHEAVITEN
jgi:DHA3 family macrolide efflux protein-like MFS transporter